jgi:hypothetical protein
MFPSRDIEVFRDDAPSILIRDCHVHYSSNRRPQPDLAGETVSRQKEAALNGNAASPLHCGR